MSKKKRKTELSQLIAKYQRYSLVEEVEKSLQEKKGIYFPITSLYLSNLYKQEYYDLNAYKNLEASIKKDGLLYPLIIVKNEDRYEIINGAKRFLLAKRMQLLEVPCFLISLSEERKISYIIENIISENDSPLLKAHCFSILKNQYHYSDKQIAEEANISLSQEKNLKRLLKLPDFLKDALNAFEISYGEARALLDLPEEQQRTLLTQLKENKLSVRDLEKMRQQYFGKSKNQSISIKKNKIVISFKTEDDATKAFNRLKKIYGD